VKAHLDVVEVALDCLLVASAMARSWSEPRHARAAASWHSTQLAPPTKTGAASVQPAFPRPHRATATAGSSPRSPRARPGPPAPIGAAPGQPPAALRLTSSRLRRVKGRPPQLAPQVDLDHAVLDPHQVAVERTGRRRPENRAGDVEGRGVAGAVESAGVGVPGHRAPEVGAGAVEGEEAAAFKPRQVEAAGGKAVTVPGAKSSTGPATKIRSSPAAPAARRGRTKDRQIHSSSPAAARPSPHHSQRSRPGGSSGARPPSPRERRRSSPSSSSPCAASLMAATARPAPCPRRGTRPR